MYTGMLLLSAGAILSGIKKNNINKANFVFFILKYERAMFSLDNKIC